MKKLISLFITILFMLPLLIFAEGLLPELDDVYGIDVPSFTRIIKKAPEKREITDQGTVCLYTGVTDKNYYDYGKALEEAGCLVKDYYVNEQSIEVILSLFEKDFSFIYNSAEATIMILYPEGVYDAQYHEQESIYLSAKQATDEGEYRKALEYLNKIPGFDEGHMLEKEIYYRMGKEMYEECNFTKAIEYLKKAKDYTDTTEILQKTYNMQYVESINQGQYNNASDIAKIAEKDGYNINQYLICQPGDSGDNVLKVLNVVNKLGFLRKIDSTYQENYTNSVIEMESRFGLTSDGIIFSDELVIIGTTLYPGLRDDRVSAVLEHLVDAGYIKGVLPDKHDIYENKYISAIIKAKTACGMNKDKLVTQEEVEAIMKLPIIEVEPATNPKANASNKFSWGDYSDYPVSLTWKASKNALFYDIYKGNSLIASKVKGTSYKFMAFKQDSYQLSVVARNYEYEAEKALALPIWVGPEQVTVQELLNRREELQGTEVELMCIYQNHWNCIQLQSIEIDGNILYLLMKEPSHDSVIYCQLDRNKIPKSINARGSSLYCDDKEMTEATIIYGKLTTKTRWTKDYGSVCIFDVIHFNFFTEDSAYGW